MCRCGRERSNVNRAVSCLQQGPITLCKNRCTILFYLFHLMFFMISLIQSIIFALLLCQVSSTSTSTKCLSQNFLAGGEVCLNIDVTILTLSFFWADSTLPSRIACTRNVNTRTYIEE